MTVGDFILIVIAGLIVASVYVGRRDAALVLGLLLGGAAVLIKRPRIPEEPTNPAPPIDPRLFEPERTADEVQDEVKNDDRSAAELGAELEREFGRRPRDSL